MAEAVLLLPSHTEQYKSSKRDFQEFLDQISGKLLGVLWGSLCLFVLLFEYIVSAHEKTCDCGGSMPPGNTTVPMEKSQSDVNQNTLFRLTAEIQFYQIQQQ